MHILKNNKFKLLFVIASLIFSCSIFAGDQKTEDNNIFSLAVDNVWSGHRIKPYLLTQGENQFVAYFDANRQLTVAHREFGRTWRYHKVDSWLGWDSHNYVTMEVDKTGNLHVMGNMHGDPIEYFRTTEPFKVRSLKRIPVMVDRALERRMTYPIFMLNKDNDLVVKYRDGGSGNGNEIYNIYDAKTKTWSRLHENQFLDGQGLMSGYFEGPVRGPDGNFHLIWVWRNTPNAATNHSLSYATSEDLVSWTDSNGKAIKLPLTLDRTEVVDPVPPFGGMINNNVKIGFDQNKTPVISYHKYDEDGNTQIYLARKKGKGWHSVQISDWDGYRWDFGGGGSLGRFPIAPYAPEILDEKNIGVVVRRDDKFLRFVVDTKSLKTVRVEEIALYPTELKGITAKANRRLTTPEYSHMEYQVFKGVGDLDSKGNQYYLTWMTQPGNRDRAHGSISEPSALLLHAVPTK